MGRYDTSMGVEGEYEPGSKGQVLKNLLRIGSKRKMDQTEADALLAAQRRYLSQISAKTRFTAKLLCQMHRDWMGSIYEWAGRYRTVEVSKGGFVWPPAYLVPRNMVAFERNTMGPFTPLRERSESAACRVLARVQADLLLVHPFREGNGRMARWVTDLLAMQAGYPSLDYGFRGPGSKARREKYLKCVVSGYSGNYDPLADFLAAALRRAVLR